MEILRSVAYVFTQLKNNVLGSSNSLSVNTVCVEEHNNKVIKRSKRSKNKSETIVSESSDQENNSKESKIDTKHKDEGSEKTPISEIIENPDDDAFNMDKWAKK